MNEPASARRVADEAPARRSGLRGSARQRAASGPDAASERVVVIEFLWRGSGGVQPVLYLDRCYLH